MEVSTPVYRFHISMPANLEKPNIARWYDRVDLGVDMMAAPAENTVSPRPPIPIPYYNFCYEGYCSSNSSAPLFILILILAQFDNRYCLWGQWQVWLGNRASLVFKAISKVWQSMEICGKAAFAFEDRKYACSLQKIFHFQERGHLPWFHSYVYTFSRASRHP